MKFWKHKIKLGIVASLLVASMGVVSPSTVKAATPLAVYVNGDLIEYSHEPFVTNGTTYVSLRDTAKSIGATVEWDKVKRASIIRSNGDTIVHRSGTRQFEVNGNIMVDTMASSKLIKGTIMVPLRGLTEALKVSMSTKTISGARILQLTPDQVTYVAKQSAGIDKYLIDQSYSGIALVAQDGNVLLKKGYGNAGKGKLNRPDMKSRIASITKSFTASAIMKLVEQGKLSLDDPLSLYIPDFPRGNEITIHMLLSHTSGIPANFTREEGMTIEQTLAEIKAKKLDFEPGTSFKYSNGGYVLLASIVEQVSGMIYGDYLQQIVFDPLGMKETGVASPKLKVIQGYVLKDNQWNEAGYYVSQSGTGTLYSTVDDLLKWDRALYTDEILSQSSLNKMFTPYSVKNYGYGWMIKETDAGATVFHNGSGTGYSTGISRDLTSGTVVILLGNQSGIDVLTMLSDIQELEQQ
ncbi:CubicO group peptidase (beta-lactamase class C family) [Paenibacillus sp. DS2015]|uniref:serine hydrolase n=1 Tax=Paenibacillus sp. DS2015 TaxID=3373917 RepID=UPI003D1A8296